MVMDLIGRLESMLSSEELINIAKTLNKIHNPYAMDYEIWKMMDSVLGDNYRFILNSYKNDVSAYEVLNHIIMKYCPGERIIKYYLVKEHLNESDTVTLFEMNVNNSRADICSINGKSIVYEIKTEFDSTVRLKKQIDDYSKVFEYIYIVAHESHLEKVKTLVPEYCGIKTYNLNDNECKFITKRKAKKNSNIDYLEQIKNLTSADLKILLRDTGIKNIPTTRKEREEILLKNCNERKINKIFKSAIKQRYYKQWSFLCDNFENILPIDIQSFFHSPMNPKLLYSESIYMKNFKL